MHHVFFGHDDRVEAGTSAFLQSVLAHARAPIALVPLTKRSAPDVPDGSNTFTFSRFLVPWIMGFRGVALYVDGSDMLCRDDIAEIFALADQWKNAVQVVKHDYRTRHPRKYRGSAMEAENADYPRKQWASVMLINCASSTWKAITPEYVRQADPLDLLQLRFLPDDRIGHLSPVWNWLVDEHGENADAKIIHFTAGIPAIPAHADAPMSDEWRTSLRCAGEVRV